MLRIKALNIVGFGKWHNTTFQLDDGIQLFYGNNEAGKSTIYQFILSILFGFPSRRGKKQDFTPYSGYRYGGSLILEHSKHGEIQVKRFKGENSGKAIVSLKSGQEGDDQLLQQLLAPLNKDLFTEVFTFQQQQLGHLSTLTEAELQEHLLAVSLYGSQQILDFRSELLSENKTIYKSKGQQPVINQKLKELISIQRKIQKQEQREAEYMHFLNQEGQAQAEYQSGLTALEELENGLTTTQQQLKLWPLYEEWQKLYRKTYQQSQFSKVDFEMLESIFQRYRFLQASKDRLVKEQTQSTTKQNASPLFSFYLENEASCKRLDQQQVSVERKLANAKWIKATLNSIQDNLNAVRQRYQWSVEALPKTPTLDQKHLLQEYADKANQLNNQLEKAQKEQVAIADRIAGEEIQLNNLEAKHADILNTSETKVPSNKNDQIKVFFGVGICLIIASVVFIPTLIGKIIGSVVGIGTLSLTGYLQIKQKQRVIDYQNNEKIREAWRNSLSKLDVYGQENATALAQIAEIQSSWQQYQTSYEQGLLKLGISNPIGPNQLGTLLEEVEKLNKLIEQQKQLTTELNKIQTYFMEYRQQAMILEPWFRLQKLNVSQISQTVHRFIEKMEQIKNEAVISGKQSFVQSLLEIQKQMDKLQQESKDALEHYELSKIEAIPAFLNEQKQLKYQLNREQELENQLIDYFPKPPVHLNQTVVKDQLVVLQEKIEEQKKQVEEQQAKRYASKHKQEFLAQDGTLDELYQQEAEIKSSIEHYGNIWMTQELAAELLQRFLYQQSDRQLPDLLKKASGYFSILTSKMYEKIKFQKKILWVESIKNGLIPVTDLSTGTQDQLFIALRLAFISMHSQSSFSPVIIDDGWLHYDCSRKEKLADVLFEFSKENQIICFSSDEEMRRYFEKNHHKIVYLEGGD